MRSRILRNAARCNFCGEVIESTYRHDFKTCRCGRVSVDGGHDYLRRCAGRLDDYTDLSETAEEVPEASGGSEVFTRLTQGIVDADQEEADEILQMLDKMKENDLKIGQTHCLVGGRPVEDKHPVEDEDADS